MAEKFNLDDIAWVEKKKAIATSKCSRLDVHVTFCKYRNNSKCLVFGFKNDKAKMITSTGFMVFKKAKNRIYFKEADAEVGYKASQNSAMKKTSHYVRVCLSDYEINEYKIFNGEYSLEYDEFNELYYIEIKENN